MTDWEPVFIAANVREVDFLEKLLDAEGIEYEVTPEAYVKEVSGVCLQGLMFSVLGGQADFVRRLLTERGLQRGVIEHPPP